MLLAGIMDFNFPSVDNLSGLSWSLNLVSVLPSTDAGSCVHTALGEIFSHANSSNILRKQHTLGHENFHWISLSADLGPPQELHLASFMGKYLHCLIFQTHSQFPRRSLQKSNHLTLKGQSAKISKAAV